jgi:WD40 repeat protein
MGQVFLGVSRGGRRVAVKVMRPDLVADAEFRARFAREVAVARTVNGFYTAPVVDADPDANPPWMVTAYVQGPSLAAAVAERGPLSEPEVRSLAAALAEGLASIHAGGLVHRDLKPANIILASDGPRIIDFGIARAVGASTMTAQGTIIGTFTYMSPEQVMGQAAGPPSDVFSLGSVIVFAATGHGPFEGDSLPAISHRILSEPGNVTGLPGALHELVAGCLTKDRGKRMSLDALLTRLEATDTPPGMPAPGYVVTELADSAPVAAPVAAPASAPAWTPRPAAPSATHRAAPAGQAQGLGAAPAPAPPSVPPLPSTLLATSGWPVTEVAFSPDGRLVAGAASGGAEWRVFLWDLNSRELTRPPVAGRGPRAPKLEFSPDGRLLVLKKPEEAQFLSLETGEFLSLPAAGRGQPWKKARFSPDGRLVAAAREVRRASGFGNFEVRLWDYPALRPVAGPFKVDYVAADSVLAFSPDGRYLFVGHEGQGFLGDVRAAQPALRKLKDLRGSAGRASFSADGSMLAVQRADRYAIAVFDTASQAPLVTLDCDREPTRVEFAPASGLLATAMASRGNEAIALWYLTGSPAVQSWPAPVTGSRLALTGFALPVADLRFSPDGAFLAAASVPSSAHKRTRVRIWNAGDPRPGAPLDLPGPVRLTVSPDSRFLAASCPDQAVRVLALGTESPMNVLAGLTAAFSPASGLLATTAPAGLRLWTLPE